MYQSWAVMIVSALLAKYLAAFCIDDQRPKFLFFNLVHMLIKPVQSVKFLTWLNRAPGG